MRIPFLFIVLLINILVACKNRNEPTVPSSSSKISKEDQNLKESNPPFFDTAIQLNEVGVHKISNDSITRNGAEAALYRYFEAQGILPRQAANKSQKDINSRLFIDFDTIYQIKNDAYSGAVVSYWIGPIDLNGHCFLPNKAFIHATPTGYKISNEDFIPSNFCIDSTIASSIYGYEYDCGGKGAVRKFRIRLH